MFGLNFILAKFSKTERLTGKKEVSEIFRSELSFRHGSVKFLCRIILSTSPEVKVAFIVPKRNIKLAVNRNKIKRQMREIWRANKSIVQDQSKLFLSSINIALLYQGRDLPEFRLLENHIMKCIEKFSQNATNLASQTDAGPN